MGIGVLQLCVRVLVLVLVLLLLDVHCRKSWRLGRCLNRPLPGLGAVRRRGRNQRAPLDTERRRPCRRFDPSGLGAFVLAAAKAVRRVKGPLRQVALRARRQLARGLIRFDDDDDEELQERDKSGRPGGESECNEWIRFVKKNI